MGTATMKFNEGVIVDGTAGNDTHALIVSGSLVAKQRHVTTSKFNINSTVEHWLRFDAAGQNNEPGENNMLLAPTNGRLISMHLRSSGSTGTTVMKLWRNAGSYSLHDTPPGNPRAFQSLLDTQTENVSGNFTTTKFLFDADAGFNEGDTLGISITPAANPGPGNLTCVWEFDFVG